MLTGQLVWVRAWLCRKRLRKEPPPPPCRRSGGVPRSSLPGRHQTWLRVGDVARRARAKPASGGSAAAAQRRRTVVRRAGRLAGSFFIGPLGGMPVDAMLSCLLLCRARRPRGWVAPCPTTRPGRIQRKGLPLRWSPTREPTSPFTCLALVFMLPPDPPTSRAYSYSVKEAQLHFSPSVPVAIRYRDTSVHRGVPHVGNHSGFA